MKFRLVPTLPLPVTTDLLEKKSRIGKSGWSLPGLENAPRLVCIEHRFANTSTSYFKGKNSITHSIGFQTQKPRKEAVE